jgi:hypothetical protein
MSTKRSAGPGVSTQEKVRCASKPKKDRSPNLCAFTFADAAPQILPPVAVARIIGQSWMPFLAA